MKNVAVSTEDGAFAVFSRPPPGDFATQGKPGGGGGGWVAELPIIWLESFSQFAAL